MFKESLAVYIHWPFCLSKCPYCDFNSHVREKIDHERWQNALLRELEYMYGHTDRFVVSSVFFGGGTPSLMPPTTVYNLLNRIGQLWRVADNIEITLEANPTSVESGKFIGFKEAGVNRVSMGVQSLRDSELKFLGRGHSAKEGVEAIELSRKIFDRYSFDLIYARPEQTLTSWNEELSEALELAGGHISLYQLTIEENTAFHHAYAKGGFILPDEELSEALYKFTEEKMLGHGLIPYEISNYALEGQESRHNLSYWRGDSYIGVGAGAHGRIGIAGGRIATQTLKSPERWLESVEKKGHGLEVWQGITPETEIDERVMMGMRLRDGINYQDFKEKTGYDLEKYINLQKRDFFMENGLLDSDKESLRAKLRGRLLLNKLTAELLSL